jgi:hypothetical protein
VKIIDPRQHPLSREHPRLYQLANQGLELLRGVPSNLIPAAGGNVWLHHTEYAGRAVHLAGHLDAAITLASESYYAPSYTVLRSALEQCCLDELLLLADRYREKLVVDDSAYDQLKAEFEAGQAPWAHSVISFERQDRHVALVRSGHPVKGDDGTTVEHLSPYHPVLERHDAILEPPDLQDKLAEAFSDPERLREWARRNRSLYHRYLKWSAIVDNLELNDRLEEREGVQLAVHYQFLSAFVHATGTGYRLIDQTAALETPDAHRHMLAELALLYACSIAVIEIRSLQEFVKRRPHVEFLNGDELERFCSTVTSDAGYFWFPRIGAPSSYDFVEEANRRASDDVLGHAPSANAIAPAQIPADEVGYYRNPLKRLASMHFGAREISTGFGYMPLW